MGDTTPDHDSCYWATVLIDNTGGGELSRGANTKVFTILLVESFPHLSMYFNTMLHKWSYKHN